MKMRNAKLGIGNAGRIALSAIMVMAICALAVVAVKSPVYGQTGTVTKALLVDTNGVVVHPTNFWTTNAGLISEVLVLTNYAPASGSPNYATSAQGALAASALQHGTSWTNISGLGTSATNPASAFATAAQGTLAAAALQPGTSWTNISGLGSAATNPASAFAPASGSANYAPASGSASYATAAQGSLAASALQPGTSWTNVSGLGTAATNSTSAFATAAQGTLATNALQPTNSLLPLAAYVSSAVPNALNALTQQIATWYYMSAALNLPSIAAWYSSSAGVTTTTNAFAGSGTVAASAGTLTFSSSQVAVLRPGDTVIAGGLKLTVQRGATNSWTSSNTNTVSAGSSFMIRRAAPRVTQWNDLSGNGRNLTNSTASQQPFFLPGRGVYFPGDIAANLVSASTQFSSSFTVISFAGLTKYGVGNIDFVNQYAGAAAGNWLLYWNSGLSMSTIFGRTISFDNRNIGGFTSGNMQPIVYTAAATAGTGSTAFYTDSLSSTETATGTGVATAITRALQIGTPTAQLSDQMITDVIICNGVVPSGQITQLMSLLKNAYGSTTVPLSSMPIVILGDSTSANYGAGTRTDYFLYDPSGLNFSNVTNAANPGDSIAQQNTAWGNLTADTQTSAPAILIQIGLNDLDPSESAATALGRYQALVNAVKAAAPQAKVILSQMTPCRARLITLYGSTNGPIAYTKWSDMNTGINGGGGTPITGADYVVTAHVALLNDGSGNLVSWADTGDGIHPNNAARTVVAQCWRAALVQAGAISQ